MNIFISILAYFIGNLSSAYFIGKYMGNIDIRSHGSGNAGATNVLRTLGKEAAALAFLGDFLKGVAAVLIGGLLHGVDGALLAGIFVIVGHNWPILLGFKGGKGIATSIGVVIAVKPLMILLIAPIAIFIIYRTKYVSLGSLIGAALLPMFMLITFQPFKYILFGLAIAILAFIRHSSNIERLLNGTENKIGKKSRVR